MSSKIVFFSGPKTIDPVQFKGPESEGFEVSH